MFGCCYKKKVTKIDPYEEPISIPLKKEVEIRDELAKRIQSENDGLKKDVKLLNACLRLPKMCDQF